MKKSSMPIQRGFTLIELVMVIVILGAIGSMVSVFMRGPIDAYIASGRRAALTDLADTTVRRMARDLRTALPNSVRAINNQCFDFIPTKTGGRYRAADIAAGDGTSLNFAATDNAFNMLGDNAVLPASQRIAVADQIVVYNLGIAGADAYARNNVGTVSAVVPVVGTPPETRITLNPSVQFPLESGSNRFHVVPSAEPVVTYVCVNPSINAAGRGTGILYRFARPAAASYPAAVTCPAIPANTPQLALNVSDCNFVVGGTDLQRNALVSMRLQLTDANETVSLHHEVHVSNTP